jgi:hypothetical protein
MQDACACQWVLAAQSPWGAQSRHSVLRAAFDHPADQGQSWRPRRWRSRRWRPTVGVPATDAPASGPRETKRGNLRVQGQKVAVVQRGTRARLAPGVASGEPTRGLPTRRCPHTLGARFFAPYKNAAAQLALHGRRCPGAIRGRTTAWRAQKERFWATRSYPSSIGCRIYSARCGRAQGAPRAQIKRSLRARVHV